VRTVGFLTFLSPLVERKRLSSRLSLHQWRGKRGRNGGVTVLSRFCHGSTVTSGVDFFSFAARKSFASRWVSCFTASRICSLVRGAPRSKRSPPG